MRAHACFRTELSFPLKIADQGSLTELWRNLSYRVIRQPGDLLAHTRRIRLCQEPALRAKLTGALTDLQWVLNGRGNKLLNRLVNESSIVFGEPINLPRLTDIQYLDTIDDGRVLPSLAKLRANARSESSLSDL